MVSRNEIPCKDCEDRQVGCHGSCEKYAEMKRKSEERNKQLATAMQVERLNKFTGRYRRGRR